MSKFMKLYENNLSRYTNGGFSGGDLVKFKEGALKDDFFKNHPAEILERVKELIGSGLNLRVTNIKPKYPVAGSGINSDGAGVDFSIEIAQELMPGKVIKHITVPASLLERIDVYPSLPPIPKVLEYDNKIQLKPRLVGSKREDNEEVEFYKPHPITNTSDLGGGKMSTGDRELLNKNTKIPAKEADKHKDPAKYTARYLPKN